MLMWPCTWNGTLFGNAIIGERDEHGQQGGGVAREEPNHWLKIRRPRSGLLSERLATSSPRRILWAASWDRCYPFRERKLKS